MRFASFARSSAVLMLLFVSKARTALANVSRAASEGLTSTDDDDEDDDEDAAATNGAASVDVAMVATAVPSSVPLVDKPEVGDDRRVALSEDDERDTAAAAEDFCAAFEDDVAAA